MMFVPREQHEKDVSAAYERGVADERARVMALLDGMRLYSPSPERQSAYGQAIGAIAESSASVSASPGVSP